jgi:hypothetical protein
VHQVFDGLGFPLVSSSVATCFVGCAFFLLYYYCSLSCDNISSSLEAAASAVG